jgi:hypothetical protein
VWDSGAVISSILIGTLGIVTFVFYEHRWAQQPMIPLHIFASRTAAAGFVQSFSLGFDLWVMQYYLIQYVSQLCLVCLGKTAKCSSSFLSLRDIL